jgi:hypothetical protein
MKGLVNKVYILLKDEITIFPILMGILFLLNELRHNIAFFSVKESLFLILIVLAFTFLVNFIGQRLVKDKIKAGLIVFVFIFINLFYQDIYQFVLSNKLLISIINFISSNNPVLIILPVLIIGWIIYAVFIFKSRSFNSRINLYLNVVFLLFIIVEIIRWIISPEPEVKLTESNPYTVNINLQTEQKPDIYYIILDSYTSYESLKKYWNYDNSGFEDSLKRKGFFISRKSKADYALTPYCLSSYLNSSHLLLDSAINYNERNLLQLIRENRLFKWLRFNNYACYNYSYFDISGNKRYYNACYYDHYLGRTIWYSNAIQFYHLLIPSSRGSQTNLNIFKDLAKLAKRSHDAPLFVYAHIMMPHGPYIFNETGMPFNPSETLTDDQKYLKQLIYTNSLTLETVNQILKFSIPNTTIIIQGDHGYRKLENTLIDEKSSESYTIFYGIKTSTPIVLTDSMNPENTFKNLIDKINTVN